MKIVRTKMKCNHVLNYEDSKSVKFNVVLPSQSVIDEDKEFFKWTPSGSLAFDCLNPKVEFTPGKTYYVDIVETEEEK